MKSRLIILLLALTTAGCSTIPTSTMPITMQSGKPVPTARIYQAELTVPSTGRSAKVSFLRDAGFLGGACTHKILVDGKTVFAIRAGEFQTLHLAPGRHAFALEIEGGVCPAFSTSHSTVLADGAEETYRIFVPPLISPTLGTTIAAGPPQVQIVGATKGAARDSSDGLQGRIENGRYSAPNGKVMFSEGWRINFDGSGSSPVIADGVLYVGSADGAVYALDPSTGETKWRFQTGEGLSSLPQVITVPRGTSVDDQMAAGMSAAEKQRAAGIKRVDMTPLVESGTVFIGSGDHSFYAIDAATGKKKWSYEAGAGMASNSPLLRAPMLKNGTVYFVTEEGLHALDALTGKRKWLFETLQEVPVNKMNLGRKRTPAGPVPGNGVIYLTAWPFMRSDTPMKSFLYAVDPESGKAKWATSVDDLDITEPVAVKGLVFVATHSSVLSSSRQATLYAINAADGQIKWKFGSEKNYGTSRLLVSGNAIYFSTDKSASALELETGRQLWSFSASIFQTDDQHLYIVTHKGTTARPDDTLHALALTTGQEKWSRGLSGNASVAMVHDGVVYAVAQPPPRPFTGRMVRHLHAMDAATGKMVWFFKGIGLGSAPVISGGRIFVTSPTVTYIGMSRVDQGYLYAIDAKTGKP